MMVLMHAGIGVGRKEAPVDFQRLSVLFTLKIFKYSYDFIDWKRLGM